MGKHHFWIFPNLTEDCGVIESFKPFIKHDVYDSTKELKEIAKKKRQEKEDAEEEEENESENENDKNNGFEMINGQDEHNDGENGQILDEEDRGNEEYEDEENESDDTETKKDK